MRTTHRKTGNRVYIVNYHFVFCPKYRRKCLVGLVKEWVEAPIRQKITDLGGEVVALDVMPGHVHLFAAITPDLAPNQIVAQVKGITSRFCRQKSRIC